MNHRKNVAYQEEKTHEIPDDALPPEPQRILLLEDDTVLATHLKEFLESCRYHVTVVGNGAEGLQQLLADDFDAIVCDMVMPNFPGDMFYLAVQRSRPHLCSRFLFTSGHRADPKVDLFIRSVRGLALWKPFEPHELLAALKSILQKGKPSKVG
jgi:two-component system response regulator PfeR